LSLVIAGIAYPDGAPAPNTRVELPGVGYAVLNEQIARGDGLQSAGITINMIHVYLLDPVSGAAAGEIVVSAATSTATLCQQRCSFLQTRRRHVRARGTPSRSDKEEREPSLSRRPSSKGS